MSVWVGGIMISNLSLFEYVNSGLVMCAVRCIQADWWYVICSSSFLVLQTNFQARSQSSQLAAALICITSAVHKDFSMVDSCCWIIKFDCHFWLHTAALIVKWGSFVRNTKHSKSGTKKYPTSKKKQDTLLLPITLLNIDRFSKFFHLQTQYWLPNGMITKDPTAP